MKNSREIFQLVPKYIIGETLISNNFTILSQKNVQFYTAPADKSAVFSWQRRYNGAKQHLPSLGRRFNSLPN
jgi:hypothetical protein